MNEQYNKAADSIINAMTLVSTLPKSRESSLTFTKLEEALMWLMKADQMNSLNKPVPGVGGGK
jgi:hypothetical protein